MKLLKTSVAAALAMACMAPAMAANVDVYGKANLGLRYVDEGNDPATPEEESGYSDVKSYASRFGVKGDADLGGKLKAVYKMEFEVDMSDKKDSKDNHIKGRNQYVGLKGGFGTFLLGRNDTMVKQSQGKLDLYSDHEADIKSLWEGENRSGNSLTYKSPKFADMAQFGLTYITEGSSDKDAKDGFSLALMLGDAKLKKQMFYAALSYDSEVDGMDIIRALGYAKFAGFRLGLGVQTQEESEVAPGAKSEDYMGYLVNGQYKIGDVALNLQFQTMEGKDGAKDNDPFIVTGGIDYKLGKMTKARAYYTMLDVDTDAKDDDKDYFTLGIVHKF
ncbi:porin [Algicola sagamiensis]|uniref:porin n=1 Tax=Algicola sagamiensis TaxID=163869 RepID=UPI0003826F44|nr:porin [Algicola sagamiensis]